MSQASQEELCGGDGADGHHVHQQPGAAAAGTHERGAGPHRRLQEHPTQQVRQRGVLLHGVRSVAHPLAHGPVAQNRLCVPLYHKQHGNVVGLNIVSVCVWWLAGLIE